MKKSKSKKALNGELFLYPITVPETEAVKFATIDVETQSWINFVCGGIYYKDSIYRKPKMKITGDEDDLMEACFTIAEEEGITDFFAHFGGKFDFNFFLRTFLTDKRYIVESIIPRGSGILSFKVRYNLSHCDLYNLDFSYHELTFRDSSALLPFSLSMLTNSFKVESLKGYIDYNFIKHAWENQCYIDELVKNDKFKVYRRWTEELVNPITGHNYKVYRYHQIKTIPEKFELSEITYTNSEDKDPDYVHKIYTKKDLITYLEDDLKGLYQVLEKFYSWELIVKSAPAFTIAGQAMNVMRSYLKAPLVSIPKDQEGGYSIEDFVRKTYFGGRTEVFKPVFQSGEIHSPKPLDKNKIKELIKNKNDLEFTPYYPFIYYYDVNSLYPQVMRSHEYPVTFKRFVRTKIDYDEEEFAFWNVTVEVPTSLKIPPLGVYHIINNSKKFVFPTGVFQGHWTSYELKYAESIGVKILKFHKGVAFNSGGYIFKDFIEDLYARRKEAQAKGDSVSELLCKLVMNSSYGRFGMDINKENLCMDTFEEDTKPHSEILLEDGDVIRLAMKPVTLEKTFRNPAIASWVTSTARVLMHKHFMTVGQDKVFYTDTDSMFTPIKMETSKELGAMKLEYLSKSAVFLLPKTYILDGIIGAKYKKKVTMKGFDTKKIKHFNTDDFLSYLEGEIRYLNKEANEVDSKLKIAQEPKFATFKTALKNGMFVMLDHDPKTKKEIHEKKEKLSKLKGKPKRYVKKEYSMSERALKAVYDKRIIINNGFDTKPIHLGGLHV